ncbi:2-oxoglutarate and oxygenase superfamily protein [Perilla frutescens var. hirtella]|nr:2-oxoglutarate and oxygenase superfamily protein [Perilla frutescens var. hirtella]
MPKASKTSKNSPKWTSTPTSPSPATPNPDSAPPSIRTPTPPQNGTTVWSSSSTSPTSPSPASIYSSNSKLRAPSATRHQHRNRPDPRPLLPRFHRRRPSRRLPGEANARRDEEENLVEYLWSCISDEDGAGSSDSVQTNYDAAVQPLDICVQKSGGAKKFDGAVYGKHLVSAGSSRKSGGFCRIGVWKFPIGVVDKVGQAYSFVAMTS